MYQYPYGNLQQLNLDWILNKIKELQSVITPEIITDVANALIAHSFRTDTYYGRGEFVFNTADKKLYIRNNYTYPPAGSAWNDIYWDECVVGDILTPVRNMALHHATLLSTGDDTDRTVDIINQLNVYRICVLGNGYFYTSGIYMPSYTTLKGISSDSIIRLEDGNNKTAVVLGGECTLENVQIIGADSNITISSTIGTRHGVEWTDPLNENSNIHNCKIKHFSGAGVLLEDTSQQTFRGLMISDCALSNNNCGIYIKKNSEYNKICNCIVTRNYYGIINRGGNNIVSNCGFDANTFNARIDNDEGANGGHGAMVGCTFNHAGGNTGNSLYIKGTGRMLISACNFGYGKITLESTDGNVFSGCGFLSSTPIYLINNACNIFCGCMFRDIAETPVTVTGADTTRFIECYLRNGAPFRSNLSEYLYMGRDTTKFIYIEPQTDYDTLTTAGSYYCASKEDCETMTNAPPPATTHNLYVIALPTIAAIIQIAVINYTTSSMLVRAKQSGGSFGKWHLIVPIKITDTVTSGTGTQTFTHVASNANAEVLGVYFGTPENVGSDVTITPQNGTVDISGTFYGSTTVTYFIY